jgi:putative ATPase
VDASPLSQALVKRWHRAEAALVNSPTDPRFNWQAETVVTLFRTAGFTVEMTESVIYSRIHLSAALLQRWFATDSTPPSYRDQLAPHLTAKDLATLQDLCQRQLQGQTVQWRSPMIYLSARWPPQP